MFSNNKISIIEKQVAIKTNSQSFAYINFDYRTKLQESKENNVKELRLSHKCLLKVRSL